MHTNPGNVQIKFAASIGRSDFFEPVRAAKCGDNKNMLATQIAGHSIPTSIEIGGGAHLASLCRPLPGLSYYCTVIEGFRSHR